MPFLSVTAARGILCASFKCLHLYIGEAYSAAVAQSTKQPCEAWSSEASSALKQLSRSLMAVSSLLSSRRSR